MTKAGVRGSGWAEQKHEGVAILRDVISHALLGERRPIQRHNLHL